jgi:hypothetical protein
MATGTRRSEKQERLTLRLPARLKTQIESQARDQVRSLQQQCVYLLRRGLEDGARRSSE